MEGSELNTEESNMKINFAEVEALQHYLRVVVPALTGGDHRALVSAVYSPEGKSVLARVAMEKACPTFLIHRIKSKEFNHNTVLTRSSTGQLTEDALPGNPHSSYFANIDAEWNGNRFGDSSISFADSDQNNVMKSASATADSFCLGFNLNDIHNSVCTIAFVKQKATITLDRPMQEQFQVVLLPSAGVHMSEALQLLCRGFVQPALEFHRQENADHEISELNNLHEGHEKVEFYADTGDSSTLDVSSVKLTPHPRIQKAEDLSKHHGKTLTISEVEGNLKEQQFLNELQRLVSSWTRSIVEATHMRHDVWPTTVQQEVQYWTALQKELENIEYQLNSTSVEITLAILRQGGRQRFATSLEADIRLAEAQEEVAMYRHMLNDFPIDLLFSSKSNQISGIRSIFKHMRQRGSTIRQGEHAMPKPTKLSLTAGQPTNERVILLLQRSLGLATAVGKDLRGPLVESLISMDLMQAPYEDFQEAIQMSIKVFEVFEEEAEEYGKFIAELCGVPCLSQQDALPMSETDIAKPILWQWLQQQFIGQIGSTCQLKIRLKRLQTIRRNHQQFAGALDLALAPLLNEFKYRGLEHDLSAALRILATVDALGSSPENPQLWAADLAAYDRCIAALEDRIVVAIREVLSGCSGAGLRLQVLHGSCGLLARPRIKEALLDEWMSLIESLQSDLVEVKANYRAVTNDVSDLIGTSVLGISCLPGAVAQVMSVQRWLAEKTTWLLDLLPSIGDNLQAQDLLSHLKAFLSELDPQKLVNGWQIDVESSGLELTGPILESLPSDTAGDSCRIKFKVRYNPDLEQLVRDVRDLQSIGCHISHSLLCLAFSAHEAWPSATALNHILCSFSADRAAVSLEAQPLVEDSFKDMEQILTEGLDVEWDMEEENLEVYVGRAWNAFEVLEDRVSIVTGVHANAETAVALVNICPYQDLPSAVDNVRAVILQAESLDCGLGMVNAWAEPFKAEVRLRLLDRLSAAMFTWLTYCSAEELKLSSEAKERKAELESPSSSNEKGNDGQDTLTGTQFCGENSNCSSIDSGVSSLCKGSIECCKGQTQHVPQPVGKTLCVDVSISVFEKFVCDVTMDNDNVHVKPPLEQIQLALLDCLKSLLAVICDIKSLNFPGGVESTSHKSKQEDDYDAVSENNAAKSDIPVTFQSVSLSQEDGHVEGDQITNEPMRDTDNYADSVTPSSNSVSQGSNQEFDESDSEDDQEVKIGKRKWEKFKMDADDSDEQQEVVGKRRANGLLDYYSDSESNSITPKHSDLLSSQIISSTILLDQKENCYWELLQNLPGRHLDRASEAINDMMFQAQHHVTTWMQYDTNEKMLERRLKAVNAGSLSALLDLYVSCEELMLEMVKGDSIQKHGALITDCSQMKSLLSSKIQIQMDILKAKLAESILGVCEKFSQQIEESRTSLSTLSTLLEKQTLSKDVLASLASFNHICGEKSRWEETLGLMRKGEKQLEEGRWNFPDCWSVSKTSIRRWEKFLEELQERQALVHGTIPVLEHQILAQQDSIKDGIQTLVHDWSIDQPCSLTDKPNRAISILNTFSQRRSVLQDSVQQIADAQRLFNDINGKIGSITATSMLESLEAIDKEICEVQAEWSGLDNVWNNMETLNSSPWLKTDLKMVSSKLETAERELCTTLGWDESHMSTPGSYQTTSHVNVYQSPSTVEAPPLSPVTPELIHSDPPRTPPSNRKLSHVVASWYGKVKTWLSVNPILQDLRSAPLRDWHWESLLNNFGLKQVPLEKLTFGNLWSVDLSKHEAEVRATIQESLGQMAIEQFLSRVGGEWNQKVFDLVKYHESNRRVVRGLEGLMGLISEHVGMLGTVRTSPYLGPWEIEAANLESKLQKLGRILEALSTVQQSWVQLEGMFGSSGDAVCQQLPTEHAIFTQVDKEFQRVITKLNTRPHILTLLEDLNLEGLLNGMGQTLKLITERIHDFLEQQRDAFPRFYLLGDEDLLELLGYPNDLAVIQKHLRKLFVGIASLRINDEVTAITGVVSPEGEHMVLATPLLLESSAMKGGASGSEPSTSQGTSESSSRSKGGDAAATLKKLEEAVKFTLISHLRNAYEELGTLDGWWTIPNQQKRPEKTRALSNQNPNIWDFFITWTVKYPLQVVVLSLQLQWTAVVEASLNENPSHFIGGKMQILQTMAGTINDMLEALAGVAAKQGRSQILTRLQVVITVLVHQRDTLRHLGKVQVDSVTDFAWLACTRLYITERLQKSLPKTTAYELTSCTFSDKERPAFLSVCMADGKFLYGFEYLGQSDRLVQTELTDRCFLALSQALRWGQGAALSGPAGTGKTETVKALGAQLGRFVVVFNCDRHFDLQALCRLLAGLARIGAWGCFDEFNRLEERILSAVSQQILAIQEGLKEGHKTVKVLGRPVPLHPSTGIFVTMNPKYAGRHHLPDNLRALLRNVTLSKPDAVVIVEVLLFVQGFRTAQRLASKLVLLFEMAHTEMSNQLHYDFSLRALKGSVKRAGLARRSSSTADAHDSNLAKGADFPNAGKSLQDNSNGKDPGAREAQLLVESVWGEMAPKLTGGDDEVFRGLLKSVFPGTHLQAETDGVFLRSLQAVLFDWELEEGQEWLEKAMQLSQLVEVHQGVLLVGPPAAGKTTTWRVVLEALGRLWGVRTVAHVIDPKALTVEELFGKLDSSTREWRDGIFTSLLRQIIELVHADNGKAGNDKEEYASKQSTGIHWVVFDGDMDPDWVENLNSVLDDNKMLVLPNGERLRLPSCVRCIFETVSIEHATPATISRLAMLHFSSSTLSLPMVLSRCRKRLRRGMAMHRIHETGHVVEAQEADDPHEEHALKAILGQGIELEDHRMLRELCVDTLLPFLEDGGLVQIAAEKAGNFNHTMGYVPLLAVESVLALVDGNIAKWVNDKAISWKNGVIDDNLKQSANDYLPKCLLQALLWGAGGSMTQSSFTDFAEWLSETAKSLPCKSFLENKAPNESLIDLTVAIEDGSWLSWSTLIPKVEKELDDFGYFSNSGLVPTIDTTRQNLFLKSWLMEGRPIILCGPPGCGKSMTVEALLQGIPEAKQVTINMSRLTSPSSLLHVLMQHCQIVQKHRDGSGYVLQPRESGIWLAVFCDGINEPAFDDYGTQSVVSFLRELWEQGGFWDSVRLSWVDVQRIKWVASCTSSADNSNGLVSPRCLRHAAVLAARYPSAESLRNIFGVWSKVLMQKAAPNLERESDTLAAAMVDMYFRCQKRSEGCLHDPSVYSPRDISRWMKRLQWALERRQQEIEFMRTPVPSSPAVSPLSVWSIAKSPLRNEFERSLQGSPNISKNTSFGQDREDCNFNVLVRLWLHEGLRIWKDRLSTVEEKEWIEREMDLVAHEYFPAFDMASLSRPMYYTTWFSTGYECAPMPRLLKFLERQLALLQENPVNDNNQGTPKGNIGFANDTDFLISSDTAERVLHMNLILQQPGGHLLVAGGSGTGKSIIAGFAAQLAGLQVVVAVAHGGYNVPQLDVDLWALMQRAGCNDEAVCLIMDEAQCLQPRVLEKLNSLLVHGEVLGVKEDANFQTILKNCRSAFKEDGEAISQEGLYELFVKRVLKNLHVCLIMTADSNKIKELAQCCPALLNNCVLYWCSPFSHRSLLEMAKARTAGTVQRLFPSKSHLSSFTFDVAGVTIRNVQTNSNGNIPTILSDIDPDLQHEAVANCLVGLHKEAAEVFASLPPPLNSCASLASFQDLLQHFVTLLEKHHKAANQQLLHLKQGLSKVQTTEQELGKLQVLLVEKGVELEQKKAEATEKLHAIMIDQKLVEKQQSSTNDMVSQLEKQQMDIGQRREDAQQVLAKAEPAVEQARISVQRMNKKNLDELRFLPNPPEPVKQTLEAVCLLLSGSKPASWLAISSTIRKTDFIPSIVAFRLTSLNETIISRIRAEYLNHLTYQIVYRASTACGPLFQWMEAVVVYGEILIQVQPFRNEVAALEEEHNRMQRKLDESQTRSRELQARVDQLLEENAVLEREAKAIASEIAGARHKMERAQGLLNAVSQERTRWSSETESLGKAISSLAGKAAVGAAFLAYLGPLDEGQRAELIGRWESVLAKFLTLGTRPKLGHLVDLICTEDERLLWIGRGIPSDDVSLQNASILGKSQRALLLVDPVGQMTEFFKKSLQVKWPKIGEVSAMDSDSSIIGEIECAARLGYPLIVRGVVNQLSAVVPILCQLGGRLPERQTLIQFAGREVSVAPSFKLILVARTSLVEIPEGLCSKVLVISAALTETGLQNTLLSQIVSTERPEVEEQRNEAQKLQGEIRIRELEHSLLSALSDSPVALIENQSLLRMLESIKEEAAALGKKAAELEYALEEIQAARAHYRELAKACSHSFFVLRELQVLSPLYQFSLRVFLEVFQRALARVQKRLNDVGVSDFGQRAHQILLEVLHSVLNRYSGSLQTIHRLPLGLRLAHIALGAQRGGFVSGDSLEYLARQQGWFTDVGHRETVLDHEDEERKCGSDREAGPGNEVWVGSELLFPKKQKLELMKVFQSLPQGGILLKKLLEHIRKPGEKAVFVTSSVIAGHKICLQPGWEEVVCSAALPPSGNDFCGSRKDGESHVNESYSAWGGCRDRDILVAFVGTVFATIVEPATFKERMTHFIATVLSPRFREGSLVSSPVKAGLELNSEVDDSSGCNKTTISPPSLATFIHYESTTFRPILLVCMPNYNPTAEIAPLAQKLKGKGLLECLAMGSKDTRKLAEKAVQLGAREGAWVVLENIHLDGEFIPGLEQLFRRAHANAEFRLILTMEAAGYRAVPRSFVETCDVQVMEAPSGLRSSLQRSLSLLTEETEHSPEGLKALVLLAWLHAVLLERLRYVPIGWFHHIDFSDTDFRTALTTVKAWLEASLSLSTGHSRNVPWTAVTSLLTETVYGQKLESEQDREILRALVHRYLTPLAGMSRFTLTGPLRTAEISGAVAETQFNKEKESANSPVRLPDVGILEQYRDWVRSLPEDCPTEWLGLWAGAEDLRVGEECQRILTDFRSLQFGQSQGSLILPISGLLSSQSMHSEISEQMSHSSLLPETEEEFSAIESESIGVDSSPPDQNSLGIDMRGEVEGWLAELEGVDFWNAKARVSDGELKLPTPMVRWLMRELNTGACVLKEVTRDLNEALSHRISMPFTGLSTLGIDQQIFLSVIQHDVPDSWLQLSGQSNLVTKFSLGSWLALLRLRLSHLVERSLEILSTGNEGSASLSEKLSVNPIIEGKWWLGGLFHPQAFLSACRQVVSQTFQWPIEELFCAIYVEDPAEPKLVTKETGKEQNPMIRVSGLKLQGCFWKADDIMLELPHSTSENAFERTSTDSLSHLSTVRLVWMNSPNKNFQKYMRQDKEATDFQEMVSLPVFLDETRSTLLFFAKLRSKESANSLLQQGAGILALAI